LTTSKRAVSEAVRGAQEIVAHGILRNEDRSGQIFSIRDVSGKQVATVPFRNALPGRLGPVEPVPNEAPALKEGSPAAQQKGAPRTKERPVSVISGS